EKIGGRPYDAKLSALVGEAIPQAVGDGRLDIGGVLAVGEGAIVLVVDGEESAVEVVDSAHHQLQPAPGPTDDEVVAPGVLLELVDGDPVNHDDAHYRRHSEGHRQPREERRQLAVGHIPPGNGQKVHFALTWL